MRTLKMLCLILFSASATLLLVQNWVARAQDQPSRIGERAVGEHLNQADIDSGKVSFEDLLIKGLEIIEARWTLLDGQGRPAALAGATPTSRNPANAIPWTRVSGTDATSCVDCHNQPTSGGAGGFIANVFVGGGNFDPPIESVSSAFSNERNTLGANGSGAIELLAREMTVDLMNLRQHASGRAHQSGKNETVLLVTKGVNFGQLTARPDGSVDTSGVQGVDADLIIRPFGLKGVVNSVRSFTINAFIFHHGILATERFGIGQKDSLGNIITTDDFDEDGVPDELSRGDMTALAIFQTAMNVPGRVVSTDPARRAAARRGELLFSAIGCSDCHRPSLPLNSTLFSEPNPFNAAGNLRLQDVLRPFVFDVVTQGPRPRLERRGAQGGIVRAFTDLKRHVICDDQDPFFCNENFPQGGVSTNTFLTRKLWDVGNTSPYGHRGDLTEISAAILHHAGEARPQRERFAALSALSQNDIVEFLKQLQVLPIGSPREITDRQLKEIQLRNQGIIRDDDDN